jgi:galactokinase/galacturonokinase
VRSTAPLRALPSSDERLARLARTFAAEFGDRAREDRVLAHVPLRICPLGAHVDHQRGAVTALALDAPVLFLFRCIEEPVARVRSLDFAARADVALHEVAGTRAGDWVNYLRGAIRSLSTGGPLRRGIEGVIEGVMPIGGLSSSAAVTIAYLRALALANHREPSDQELISLVQETENTYLGLDNGILDQSAIVSGRRGLLAAIDCASREIEHIALGASAPAWKILVVHSGLSRQLTSTPFNQRVAECVQAARELAIALGRSPEGTRLGDFSAQDFAHAAERLAPELRRRATHFFSECARVERGKSLWEEGDLVEFGELINASGASSIHNYESGGPELIAIWEILREQAGVYGTRLCGGGFRGSVLALVDPARVGEIAESVHERYPAAFPDAAANYGVYACEPDDRERLILLGKTR